VLLAIGEVRKRLEGFVKKPIILTLNLSKSEAVGRAFFVFTEHSGLCLGK